MTQETGQGRGRSETAAEVAAVRAWFQSHGWRLEEDELKAALRERGAAEALVFDLVDEAADRKRAGDQARTNGHPVPAADQGGPVPPQNLDAEESVLSGMLLSPAAIDQCARILEPAEFYRDSHAKIFQAAVDLHERAPGSVDAITLVAELERRDWLDKVGGRVRIHELAAFAIVPGQAVHYARIVRETALLRGVQRGGHELALAGGTTDEVIGQVEQLLDELRHQAARGRERIQIRASTDFLSTVTDTVDVLLGAGKDRVLPAHGFGLVYGKGAAGKTTLMLTCIASLCSATPWLGIPVPRPIRVLMIENEGPKAPFIEKIKEFAGQWDGPDFQPNLSFYEEPWGRFNLADRGMRDDLLAATRDQHIDLVVAGPLRGLGIDGPGAPSETDAFLNLLKQAGLGTELAWWIVHHTNKMGQISGDWDRQPDLLLRLTYEGKRRQRLAFEKVRWGDQGREPLVLEWLDEGVGYRILDTTVPDVDWDDLADKIIDAIADHPDCSSNDVFTIVAGKKSHCMQAIKNLLERGRIEDRGTGKKGAPRKLHIADGQRQESLYDTGQPAPAEPDELEWGDA